VKNPLIQTVKSSNKADSNRYIPPIAGNGELCYLVDYTGGQRQNPYNGGYFELYPAIWWAGKRYDNHQYTMVPFGYFENLVFTENQLKILSWEQHLNPEEGTVISRIILDNKSEEEITVFSPFKERIIVVKQKIINNGDKNFKAGISYVLSPPGKSSELPKRMIMSRELKSYGTTIRFSIDGYEQYTGAVILFSDQKTEALFKNSTTVKLIRNISEKDKITELTFYILFHDNKDSRSIKEKLEYIKSTDIFQTHKEGWRDFHKKGYITIPDKKYERQWKTSLYHLRISSTAWSVPTGIFDTHWSGRYFYDEFYSFHALLSSGHSDLSRKIPVFRRNTLDKALYRTWNQGAQYAWESIEDGNDGCPHGASLNELHHCGMIALECWLQHLYSPNIEFLRNIAYPVIKNTAEFYRKWMVIELDNGTAIIQKCVDMDESIVPVLNPFYTSCSAISNFRIASQAAKLLNTDTELILVWDELARMLEKTLPNENNAFIPFQGAGETSILVLGILYPFALYPRNNEKIKNTVYDFMKRVKNEWGYPAGSSEKYKNQSWTWSSGLLATCLNLLGDAENAQKALSCSLNPVGTFGCMCEHYKYDKKIYTVPWFTTASGVYIYALNTMLLQSESDTINLLPSTPNNWKDVEFLLQAQGDIMVNARLKEGKLCFLKLQDTSQTSRNNNRVIIVEKKYLAEPPDQKEILSCRTIGNKLHINVGFRTALLLINN